MNDDYPEGFAMNVTDGILRMRYRNSWEHPQLLRQDRPSHVILPLVPPRA
jgi:uncharacterized protein